MARHPIYQWGDRPGTGEDASYGERGVPQAWETPTRGARAVLDAREHQDIAADILDQVGAAGTADVYS